MDPVVVLQWNCQSVRAKKHEVLHLISKFCPSVLALSETWLRPGIHFRISGYSCIREDRPDGHAGSALLIRRSLSFTQITLPPLPPGINAVAIRTSNISFISIYIPHPDSALIPDLHLLFSSIPSPMVIMGDFNAHHTLWGHHSSNLFGYSLLEIFDELNLCLLNDGSPTRRVFPTQNPKSAVDLSVCSPSLSSLTSWQILPLSYGSDHFPIIISISNSASPFRNPCPTLKYRLSGADWISYSSTLDLKLESSSSSLDIILSPINAYNSFVENIIDSANIHIPLKKITKHFKTSTPWWDSECTLAVTTRKEAEQNYYHNMSESNFLKYQESSAKFRKLVSKKKKLSWIGFCEDLSPKTPASLVWKQIRRFRGACNSLDITSNDPSSWIEAFSDKLAPPSAPSSDCLPSPSSYIPSFNCFDQPFSFNELTLALDGLTDSSPGIDGIPYSFIIKSSDKAKQTFLNLINYFFEYGVIPKQWKTQIIIPILKPGKDPSDPNSRRPIALSSVLAKIMEHLIKHRLEWFVENKSILAKSQFGFRKGMSTMDSLSLLTIDIYTAFMEKKSLVGVFLDIASAYDNVMLPVLRNKLIQLNIPEKLSRFTCNLLMERSVIIKSSNGLLPPKTVWKGLPQGSVLSPLLYSIYTYDIENTVNSFCEVLQYADDLALYVKDKSIETTKQKLNSALHYLDDWLQNHGLSLSTSKSSTVVFTRKRSIPSVELFVNQDIIPQSNSVKFLGIILDSRMTGTFHLNSTAEKCEKNVNIIRSLSGVWWGSHPYTQKLLYNALIRSHFDYGSFLLNLFNKAGLEKINKTQSKCLRIILGAMKSSPINAMQVECNDPPLNLRRQFLSDRFFFKLIQNSDHPLIPKLSLLLELFDTNNPEKLPCLLTSYIKFTQLPNPVHQFPTNPLYLTPFECLTFQPNILLYFGIDKDAINAREVFNEQMATKFRGWYAIFTDASKLSPNSTVGSAVWIPFTRINLSFKCPSSSSVFTGESIALLEAINFVRSHNLNNSIIFSDSKSCLQSILSNPFRSISRFPSILKIKSALFDCHQLGINVVLAWIPGHSGIPGNEVADALAKDATNIGSLDHFKIYSHDLCLLPKFHLLESWTKEWNTSKTKKGKHYADIQPEIPSIPWFFKFRKANKSTTSTICRLRLGHACTPVFLAKLRIRDHSMCECGLDEGNVNHIFFNCPKLRQSLYDILPLEFPRPFSFKCILSQTFSPLINYILCKFIHINKIKL